MKLFLIFPLILCFSVRALAMKQEFSCPETHPEYSKILIELESFKETLRANLECKDVSVNFDKITDLLSAENRKSLLSLVNNTDGKPLSAEAAKKVQTFASSLTEEIATALSLISNDGFMGFFAGTSKCKLDSDDEFTAIERLTKAAYVATNLVSKVAGPYGVPLQIGAKAFFGVVEGLQSYSKRKRHIDFDEFEKREFFEGAVCLMSKFDTDIRKLNNPESHLKHLKDARAEAQRVVSVLERQNTNIKVVLQRKQESKDNLAWIENEILRYSEIAEFKSGGIGPPQLQSVKNNINKFLLETAAPEFIEWYSVRVKLSVRDVVRKTGAVFQNLRRDLRSRGKAMNMDLPGSIEDRFSKDTYPYGDPYGLRQNYVIVTPEISNLYFVSTNLHNIGDRSYEFYSLLGEAYDLWKLSDLNVRVTQEYCEFFQNTRKYSGDLADACEDHSYVWHALRTSYQAFYLANLINDNPEIEVLGPFDFRLEKHKDYIKLYSEMREGPLVLAEAGLDFDKVLRLDKSIRIQDGRLNAANDNFPPSYSDQNDWWFDVEKHADQFIEQTQNMGSSL